MRRPIQCAAILAVSLAIASPLVAQRGGRGNDSTARGAGLPLTPAKALKFTTDEGTWLSLDVSPDSRTIVFELLGDIYTIPIDGGKATRLTSGQAFDAQPHFSPDGKSIVFVSDRSQADNLWLMNADGSNVHALTRENDQRFQSPTFTPDGKYVVASRGNDLFMYYVSGGTGGLRLTGDTAAAGRGGAPGGGRGGAPPNVFLGPAMSHDGRYIYTAMRNSTGGGYNQTSLGWQIGVFDRETGRIFTKTNAVGSGMRPEVSADGKWLAYATRNNAETSLILRDLESGDERLLLPKIQRDDQESRPNRDVVPTYAFTPDGKAIIIGHHGHFWRANVADGHETMIPFTVDVDMMIAGPTKETYPVNDESLVVRQIRDLAPSPDNKRLAFTALDRLWVMDLPNGKPRRLVPSENVGEFQPTWSPDGQYVA
ncbi:MAG TPA: amidohydrolase, partial [Gemmatimonadaceae bacterium]|nr:amidohydrolase [Gemmatimonadaceae bacterium]